MRYIRYACILTFAIALIAVALANRTFVTLKLLPDEVAGFFAVNPAVDLPLFVIIFMGILIGLLAGMAAEWMREYSIRSNASKADRKLRRLEREVVRLKQGEGAQKDDVLAILDGKS